MADRRLFHTLPAALVIIEDIRRNYPEQFQFKSCHFDWQAGTDLVRKAMELNQPAAEMVTTSQRDLKEFETGRQTFLLYP